MRTLGFQFIILDALISLNTTYETALSITYTCCASNELAGTAQTSLVGKKNVKATKFPREPERKRDVKGIKNSFSDN